MKQIMFWLALVVVSALVATLIAWISNDLSGDLLLEVVPVLLGGTTALVLLPGVVVGSVVLIRKLFKRSTSDAAVFILAGLVWMILAFSAVQVSLFESRMPTLSTDEFAPVGCEYKVSFPSKPELYEQQKATADGVLLPLHGAQLTIDQGTGYIRAECASVPAANLDQFSQENFVGYMTEIAADLGLSRSSYDVQETLLGNVGTVTGVKDTERGRITVRVINIVGESSILTLYLMALSTDFQTPGMQQFVQSVERKSG